MRALSITFAFAMAACGGSGGDDAVVFLAADEIGPDPFMADVAEPVPIEFVELDDNFADAADQAEQTVIEDLAVEQDVDTDEVVSDEAAVRQARLDAVVSTADANGVQVQLPRGSGGVALYGGSGVNACDVEAMIQFLENDNDLGDAWASVQGIERSELRSYLESLTEGFLVLDTTVINHGFKNGDVTSNEATLEAGTAVLVDDQGNIRARCKCGNPQLPINPGPDVEFSGLWRGDWGDLLVVEDGDKLRMAYSCCGVGGIEAVHHSDGVLRGWFKDSTGVGRVEFVPLADGSLDGRWHFGESANWSDGWDVSPVADDEGPAETLTKRINDDEFFADLYQD